ncbi:hypothetical protein Tco_1126010, partial [Tanacetum coccineum]
APDYRDNKIHTGWLDSRIAMRVRAKRPPWYLLVVGGALYKAAAGSAAMVSDYVGYLEKGQIPPKVKMDDPNITIEEYIRLEEEKACRRGKVYKWETTTYALSSCEPTVSSLNNEIDFKISFDDSDDEDYTIIFDKNSFSYKIISTNNLKTDSENDNEKVNMPSFPPPEPTVSCFDDLDFFKEFMNEFLAIVYNDAQTSKSDSLTEPILRPQHINEFDLNDETSLSKYDEEEQNILYFNDLFPFYIIHPDDLKLEKDNDDNEIDILQSSGGPCEGKSTNVGEEFTNLEILKCWSLENSRRLFDINSCSIKYGYMKNHMKTVKNGQTRTQERKSEQKPEAKARKRVIKSIHGNVKKMAGSYGSNQSISLAPKHQSHVAMEKAQRNEEFALHSLSKLAQAVTS